MDLRLAAPYPSFAQTVLTNYQGPEDEVVEQLVEDRQVHELLVLAMVQEACMVDVLVLEHQQDPASHRNLLYLACPLERAWSSAQQGTSCASLVPMTLHCNRLSEVAGLGLV